MRLVLEDESRIACGDGVLQFTNPCVAGDGDWCGHDVLPVLVIRGGSPKKRVRESQGEQSLRDRVLGALSAEALRCPETCAGSGMEAFGGEPDGHHSRTGQQRQMDLWVEMHP